MIIAGAKGFAKELVQMFYERGYTDRNLSFFDNVSTDSTGRVFDKFPIIRSESLLETKLCNGENFVLGVGTPKARYILYNLFKSLGGLTEITIAKSAKIGSFNNIIGEATCIMDGTIITNDVTIGKGCLINLSCTIGHDVKIGDFTEMCPDTNISGHVTIGNYCFFGTNSVVIPGVTIGDNCTIGAGCVVTTDIPDNSVVAGLPGKIIKTVEPFNTQIN